MQKIVVFFAAIFFGFYLLLNHATEVQSKAGELNKQYAKYLTNATQDAAQVMEYNSETGTFLDKEQVREDAVRIFFNTLAIMFDAGLENNTDHGLKETQVMIKHYVPAILLVDENGFYVWHSFYQGGEMQYEISPLTTWSKTVRSGSKDYYVRYFLHDHVQVSVATGGANQVFDGSVDYVKNQLQKAGLYNASLNFLDNYSKYKAERDAFVAQSVQLQLMYYINNENDMSKSDGIPDNDYYFEMPTISSGDWIEMVENPSIISFLQGNKFTDLYDFINIYSFAGGENKKTTGFVAKDHAGIKTGVKGFYHVRGKACSIYGAGDPDAIFNSRRSATMEGYDPCPECNP